MVAEPRELAIDVTLAGAELREVPERARLLEVFSIARCAA